MTSFPTVLGSLCTAAVLTTSWVALAEPSGRVSAEAKAHFQAGVDLMRQNTAQGYEEAYREFKAAYAASPTWKILWNLGQAADELERDGEAIDALEEYLDKGKREISARKRAQLRADLDRLRAGLATVTLEAPGAFWVVDTRIDAGARIVNKYGPFETRAELRVRAGEHEFELDRANFVPWKVGLVAGDGATHSFERKPEPAPTIIETFAAEPGGEERTVEADVPKPTHTMSYVLWGTGAAGAIATSVLVLEANSTQKQADADYAQRCPFGGVTDDCSGSMRGDVKAAHWRTAALVTGIGAVGAVVGGTILYLLDDDPSAGGGTTEASVQPWVSPTGIGVSGAF